jgi:26S proteasome regulatory subunit N9
MEFIEAQASAHPELAETYEKLGSFHTRKLWHQLTVEIKSFVENPANVKGDNMVKLYEGFISTFEARINQLAFAQVAVQISGTCGGAEAAFKFIKAIAEKKEQLGDEGYIICQSEVARMMLLSGKSEEAKVILDELKPLVEEGTSSDPAVQAAYYRSASTYYKINGPASTFYKTGLMLLAYKPVESMPEAEKQELAVDLALAALTGDNVYNFGEVLATPILKCLEGTPQAWLSELLGCFNFGDIDKFNTIISANQAVYNAQPALASNSEYVKEKITLLCLIELFFRRSSHDRNVPFAEIAEQTRLPVEQVEWLLMRAMSLGE